MIPDRLSSAIWEQTAPELRRAWMAYTIGVGPENVSGSWEWVEPRFLPALSEILAFLDERLLGGLACEHTPSDGWSVIDLSQQDEMGCGGTLGEAEQLVDALWAAVVALLEQGEEMT